MVTSVYTLNENPTLTVHVDESAAVTATRIPRTSPAPEFISIRTGGISMFISKQQAFDLALGIAGAIGGSFRLDSGSLGDDMLREAIAGEMLA